MVKIETPHELYFLKIGSLKYIPEVCFDPLVNAFLEDSKEFPPIVYGPLIIYDANALYKFQPTTGHPKGFHGVNQSHIDIGYHILIPLGLFTNHTGHNNIRIRSYMFDIKVPVQFTKIEHIPRMIFYKRLKLFIFGMGKAFQKFRHMPTVEMDIEIYNRLLEEDPSVKNNSGVLIIKNSVKDRTKYHHLNHMHWNLPTE